MKRTILLLLMVFLAGFAFAGGQGEEADAVSRPTEMYVTSAAEMEEAVSADGPWIIILQQDLEVSSDLVVAGEVYQEEGDDEPKRKLAFYDQDSDRNITDRYTLTVPNLIIRHDNVQLKGGIIEGDVYVEAEGFNLNDATIDGNLYFASEDVRESFANNGTVTGAIEIGSM
ncbi:MAG: hypothetical protein ACLFR1_14555 [Spirochaetia bacterium]